MAAEKESWQVPVKETVATEGRGVPELAAAIAAHRRFIRKSGEWQAREKERSRREMAEILQARLWRRVRAAVDGLEQEQLITAVARRELDPYTAVNKLLRQMEQIL